MRCLSATFAKSACHVSFFHPVTSFPGQVGDYCLRFEAFPKNFSAAAKSCEDSAGALAFIPDYDTQSTIEIELTKKAKQYSFFAGVDSFWLGATPTNDRADAWTWTSPTHNEPMTNFMNWKGGVSGTAQWNMQAAATGFTAMSFPQVTAAP